MARNHKRAKRPIITKAETAIIKQVNDLIAPFGRVTALGPDTVGVLGDARYVGMAIGIRFVEDAKAAELSTGIINRVRGIARVMVDI